MAGSDHIYYNTREKPKSADFNDAQALQARAVSDILRFTGQVHAPGLGAASVVETPVNYADGLQVIPNGNNIYITPGVLMQYSTGLSPTPGSLDSAYRLSFNRANLLSTAPAPVSNTYYLVEAQMSEVVALNEARDILDQATGNFVSTAVNKRYDRQVTVQWLAGTSTNFPTPSGGNWVVLAGVFRPAGGGAVSFSHIVDMRTTPGCRHQDRELHYSAFERANLNWMEVSTDADTTMYLDASAIAPYNGTYADGGHMMYARSTPVGTSPLKFDPATAAILDTATPLAGSTFFYMYLVPWRNLLPRVEHTNMTTRGVLVLSTVAPSGSQKVNSASLNLPAPYASVAAAGTARLVCVLRRNSGNTGWLAMKGDNHGVRFCGAASVSSVRGIGTTGTFGSGAIDVTSYVPKGVSSAMLVADAQPTISATAANAYFIATVNRLGGSPNLEARQMPAPNVTTGTRFTTEMEAPFDSAGLEVNFVESGLTISGGTTTAVCRGWRF